MCSFARSQLHVHELPVRAKRGARALQVLPEIRFWGQWRFCGPNDGVIAVFRGIGSHVFLTIRLKVRLCFYMCCSRPEHARSPGRPPLWKSEDHKSTTAWRWCVAMVRGAGAHAAGGVRARVLPVRAAPCSRKPPVQSPQGIIPRSPRCDREISHAGVNAWLSRLPWPVGAAAENHAHTCSLSNLGRTPPRLPTPPRRPLFSPPRPSRAAALD